MSLLVKRLAIFSFLVGLVTYTFTTDTLGEVRLEGEVLRAYPDYFLLTNSKGLTLVEMDDIDSYAESINLIPGDEVVVKGLVDRNALSEDSIEAKSVLVKNLSTLYLLDSADAEGASDFFPSSENNNLNNEESMNREVRGVVTKVRGSLISLETREGDFIKISLASLSCCKTNNDELIKVKVGDEVSILGRTKFNLFSPDLLEANNLLIYKY